jgi:hypothetical protein
VVSCPACKGSWVDGTTQCPVCGHDLQPESEHESWVVIGYVSDQMTADYAKEILASCEIPVSVYSRSGFFGTAGLTLPSFYKSGAAPFEISVPEEFIDEAGQILAETLGESWQKKEND